VRLPHRDQVVAAIERRTEYDVSVSELLECSRDHRRIQRRTVGADGHDGIDTIGPRLRDCGVHPHVEITGGLRSQHELPAEPARHCIPPVSRREVHLYVASRYGSRWCQCALSELAVYRESALVAHTSR